MSNEQIADLTEVGTREFKEYVDRMQVIRALSTPNLELIDDAGEYSRILLDNFSRIGKLASENRIIINQLVKPNLSLDVDLSEETKEKLEEFAELLFDMDTFGEVDVHLSDLITNRLMDEEIRLADTDDINELLISKAKKVKRDYLLISGLTRFQMEHTEEVRAQAIKNCEELAEYLEKDRITTLNEEARGYVLQFSLMGSLLFESTMEEKPLDFWNQSVAIIEKAREILADPFYRELMPEYNWETYEFRIYYYGSFLAYSVLPKEIAIKAGEYAGKAVEFLENCTNEAILSAVNLEQEKELLTLSRIMSGEVSSREACDAFYRAYEERDEGDFSITGINKNLDTPSSYLRIAKTMKMELAEGDAARFEEIERSVIDYLHHIPKTSDSYLKCVTLLTNFPTYFKEVPGAMTMEEFCIKAFAAVHPPTYIHVNMVADLTECMVRGMFEVSPEKFIGFPGCDTLEQVLESRKRITDFAYHAALCHDLGKLFIIDVISMYGRNLLDDEFEFIKNHPSVGAKIAMEHASTRDYADVIKGHHLWYDCSRGYPADFDTFKSPYKTIIDIVLAADCLDAATDTVGRCYNKGKTLDEYVNDVKEGSGTRYAPFLVDLLQSQGVHRDIEYLLTERRNKLYRDTFMILKNNEIAHIKTGR